MTVPDYQTLMLPVLRQATRREESSISALIDDVSLEFGLSADDRAALTPAGGQNLLANRLHWAKTYMQRAGLLESTRHGYFRITDRGRALLETNPSRIDNGASVGWAKARLRAVPTTAAGAR